mgnify:FL=1
MHVFVTGMLHNTLCNCPAVVTSAKFRKLSVTSLFNLEKATPQRRDFFLPNDMFMNERKSRRNRVRPPLIRPISRNLKRDSCIFSCFVSCDWFGSAMRAVTARDSSAGGRKLSCVGERWRARGTSKLGPHVV